MSIADNLNRLNTAKSDIAEAITKNGGTVEQDDGLEEYPTRITNRFTEVNSALQILLKGPTLITKSITQNGTYSAEDDEADGYSEVAVTVPNSYSAGDEGKVVSNGGLVAQTSSSTNSNGTIDTTLINSLNVNVPTYSSADNGKVIKNGALSTQTVASDSTITSNNTYTYDTTYNNSKKVVVNVPTYSASDNGKVIQNGVLSSQTAYGTVTTNGTYNTTYNNSITVNVPTGVNVLWITPQDIVKSCYLTYFAISGKLYITGYVEWKNSPPSYGNDIYFNFQSALSNIGITNTISGYIFNIPYSSGSFPTSKGITSLSVTPSSTGFLLESAGTYEVSYITGFLY